LLSPRPTGVTGAPYSGCSDDPCPDVLCRPTSRCALACALPEPTNTEVFGEAPLAGEGSEKVSDLTPTVVLMNVHTAGLDVAGGS